MSEVNGPKFSVNQVNYSGIQKPMAEPQEISQETEAPKLNDFSPFPASINL